MDYRKALERTLDSWGWEEYLTVGYGVDQPYLLLTLDTKISKPGKWSDIPWYVYKAETMEELNTKYTEEKIYEHISVIGLEYNPITENYVLVKGSLSEIPPSTKTITREEFIGYIKGKTYHSIPVLGLRREGNLWVDI